MTSSWETILDTLVGNTNPFYSTHQGDVGLPRSISDFVEAVTLFVRKWEEPNQELRRHICQRLHSDENLTTPCKIIVEHITTWLDDRDLESRHDNVTFSLVLLLRISSTTLGDCMSEIPNADLVLDILRLLNRLGENVISLSTRLGTPNAINAAFRFCSIAFDLAKLCGQYDMDVDFSTLIRFLILIPCRFSSHAVINESHCALQKFRSCQKFSNEIFCRSIDFIKITVSTDALTFCLTVARDSAASASQDALQGRQESLDAKNYPFLEKDSLLVIADALSRCFDDYIDRKYSRHILAIDQGLCAINNILVVGDILRLRYNNSYFEIGVGILARKILMISKKAFIEAQCLFNNELDEKKVFTDILPLCGTSIRVLSLICENDDIGFTSSQSVIFDFGMLGLIKQMIDKVFVKHSRFSIVTVPTADLFTKHLFNLFTALAMSGVCVVENVSELGEILLVLIQALKNSKKIQDQLHEPLPGFIYTLIGGFISKLLFASTMNPIFANLKSMALDLGAELEELFEAPD